MSFDETILIVSDFDGSLYNKRRYRNQILSAKKEEFELIARLHTQLGHTADVVRITVQNTARAQNITSSEVILKTLSYEQWLTIRLLTTWYDCLQLSMDQILQSLPKNFWFAIASHTPAELITRSFVGSEIFRIYTPRELGYCKPNPKFFKRIAKLAGLPPAQCIHIGDRFTYDVTAALEAGYMSAFHTEGNSQQLIKMIAEGGNLNQLNSFERFIQRKHRENLLDRLCLQNEMYIDYNAVPLPEADQLRLVI